MSGGWDGIILGTGHNSLVLQAYLARCGLRVLSLARAMLLGGGLATVENPRLPALRFDVLSPSMGSTTARRRAAASVDDGVASLLICLNYW
jgi:phytoene dehydrogenase-like protein